MIISTQKQFRPGVCLVLLHTKSTYTTHIESTAHRTCTIHVYMQLINLALANFLRTAHKLDTFLDEWFFKRREIDQSWPATRWGQTYTYSNHGSYMYIYTMLAKQALV